MKAEKKKKKGVQIHSGAINLWLEMSLELKVAWCFKRRPIKWI